MAKQQAYKELRARIKRREDRISARRGFWNNIPPERYESLEKKEPSWPADAEEQLSEALSQD